MKKSRSKQPKLGPAGKELLEWLEEHHDGVEDAAPAVMKQCRMEDLAHEIQDVVDGANVTKKLAAINAELKILGMWWKGWRTLGCADKPDELRRGPGRPPESERQRWRA
jgi:hypothetical protein